MAPKQIVGLCRKGTDQVIWYFESIAKAAACFGVPRTSSGKVFNKSSRFTKEGSLYDILLVEKSQVQGIPIDKSQYDQVYQIISTNAPWNLINPEQTTKVCASCQRLLPDDDEHFSPTGKGGRRKHCRACRNELVYQRSQQNREEAKQALQQSADATFTCKGWTNQQQHECLLKNKLDDRQQCRDCYNAKRKDEYDVSDPEYRLELIRKRARARGIGFNNDDWDTLLSKVKQPCAYCGHLDLNHLNGLDRVINKGGYADPNCVPCCFICNFMKLSKSLHEFVECVRAITAVHVVQASTKICQSNVTGYSRIPTTKVKSMELKKRQIRRLLIKGAKCYLCNTTENLGIDRVDSRLNYEDDNSRACCRDCNLMKNDIDLNEFLGHCNRIKEHLFPQLADFQQTYGLQENYQDDISTSQSSNVKSVYEGFPQEIRKGGDLPNIFCKGLCVSHLHNDKVIHAFSSLKGAIAMFGRHRLDAALMSKDRTIGDLVVKKITREEYLSLPAEVKNLKSFDRLTAIYKNFSIK